MIARIWHGWTTPANADAYERLLRTEIFPGILARKIVGFRDIQLLRRDDGHEVEFVTIMNFDSLDAVIAFASGPILTFASRFAGLFLRMLESKDH
ncbi:antibiotic biosynthesis monooxygenase (ABM) superfamily enzyme [Nitrobacteraceae bacterium AZCC 1564]